VSKIHSYKLKNGLHVFVHPDRHAPKVSTQLWYGVGSKDEKSGERGLAHLLEHMIFKGTARLTESDINLITHKLSGYTNAFTSYDYTGYMFDFPKRYWSTALDLLSDCMANCIFKQDLLNSELKAVIQELKMYKDDYVSTLTEEMISLIFHGHPYHYPIIGYKQDLCDITQKNLLSFYKKHYVPNNASLVVVGDVDPDAVYTKAQQYFGHMQKNESYKKESYFLTSDIKRTQITLHRDVEQPFILLAWQIPGMSSGQHFYFDVLKWLIAQGHGSRLYKKLVNELQLATYVDSFTEDLFDQGLFFVRIYPKNVQSIDAVICAVHDELDAMQKSNFSEDEFKRAMRQVRMQYLSLFEQPSELAYAIGQSWLATRDAQYISTYLDHDERDVRNGIESFLPLFSVSRMHEGSVLPMDKREQVFWDKAQKKSDEWDDTILSRKVRESEIEPGAYVDKIQVKDPAKPTMPAYDQVKAVNGLTVLTSFNDRVDKVALVLNFKAKYFYDPNELVGLTNFVYAMLQEGTRDYPGDTFMQAIESYGMALEVAPGVITLHALKEDLEKSLEFLLQMIQTPLFDKKAIEKVRAQIFSELSEFWDTPTDFVSCLAEQRVYKDHPFHKYYLGSRDSVARITRSNIIDFWDTYGSPDGAYLAIVGPVEQKKVLQLFERTLGKWTGPKVSELKYPPLSSIKKEIINYPINRDQVVLCFAGLSVDRMHKDYDALLLFDQILTGGMLGSMSSRLFALREQTGLFYTIGGSVVLDASCEPGMVMIKTIVSLDKLAQAQEMIQHTLQVVPEMLDDKEILEAKHAVINSVSDLFSTNNRTARGLIFLAQYGLDACYIKNRAEMVDKITKTDIQNAAQKILDKNQLIIIRAGRISA